MIKEEATLEEIESHLINAGEMAGANCQAADHDNLWTAIKVALGEIRNARQQRESYRNGLCAGLIQNTVVVCGEGGNYCSESCRLRSHPFETLKMMGFEVDETGLKRQKIMEQRIVELEGLFDFMRNGWSPIGARACPACVYENGVFQRVCKLHEETDRLEKEIARMTPVYEEASPCPLNPNNGYMECQHREGHGGACDLIDTSPWDEKP